MRLEINSILVPTKKGEASLPFTGAHRILDIDVKEDVCALFSMKKESTAPFNYRYSDLVRFCEDEKLYLEEFKLPGYMLNLDDMDEKYRPVFEERLALMEPFLKPRDREWMLNRTVRSRMVSDVVEQTGKPRKSINKILYRLCRYGMVPGSLVPDYPRCGNKSIIEREKLAREKGDESGQVPLNLDGPKKGRPRKAVLNGHNPENTGVNITGQIIKRIKQYGDIHYKNRKGRTLKYAHDQLIGDHYSEKSIGLGGKEITVVSPLSPSYEQFRYHYRNNTDEMDVLKARVGDYLWNTKHRALGGKVDDYLYGPCDLFEIDSTVLDAFMVSRLSRLIPVGRSIVYLVADVFSRMIVGVSIALEGPKWDTAKLALYNSFTDKVELCRRYGIDIEPEDWPCEHFSQTVLADRAELVAHKPKYLSQGLGIEVAITPPERPDYKPVVESRFDIVVNSTVHFLPGSVNKRKIEQRDRKYPSEAVLNMEEVMGTLICAILEHNNETEFEHLLTKEMITDGVTPTPRDIWNWGLENGTGISKKVDATLIKNHLLNFDKATVKADGIHWNGMRYTCELERRKQWRVRARNKGSFPKDIRWDPKTTKNIWIYDDENNEFQTCTHISPDERYEDLHVEEVVDMRAFLKHEAEDRKRERQAVRIDTSRTVEKIVENAEREATEEKARAAKAMTKKSIKENRAEEIARTDDYGLLKDPESMEEMGVSDSDILDEDERHYREGIAELMERFREEGEDEYESKSD